jgi:hypothetical protein
MPPRFDSLASRTTEYHSLAELAADATAVVIVESTGRYREVPLPEAERNPAVASAPNTVVTVTVNRVMSGRDVAAGRDIDVVAFGPNSVTGRAALVDAGRYLLFLAPYVFGPGRAGGGYVTVGGPAGVFYQTSGSADGRFVRTDAVSMDLPTAVDVGAGVPPAQRVSAEYIAAGG